MSIKLSKNTWIRNAVMGAVEVQFFYVIVYIIAVFAYDAWKLLAPAAQNQRWILSALMLVVTLAVWLGAKAKNARPLYYKKLVYALIALDIAVATFSIYSERGMSSRGVMLYAIPVAIAAVLRNRSALFGAATLSSAAYITAALSYFKLHPSEGYKIELYGTVGFYCGVLYLLALLLWVILRGNDN